MKMSNEERLIQWLKIVFGVMFIGLTIDIVLQLHKIEQAIWMLK